MVEFPAMSEGAARAADEALRSKAADREELARRMDDNTTKDGYHANSLEWFRSQAPVLRAEASELRSLGRALLLATLSKAEGAGE